jgi:hypothetical protein
MTGFPNQRTKAPPVPKPPMTEKVLIDGAVHELHIDVVAYIFNKCVRIQELEGAIRNLHQVKGRYHTQQACKRLFALVGLGNNIGVNES